MPVCQIEIKAAPNASRSQIVGWLGDTLKIRLAAPPVDGKANLELTRFLAQTLGLPKSAVTLVTGAASRQKRVRIDGLSREDVTARLTGD